MEIKKIKKSNLKNVSGGAAVAAVEPSVADYGIYSEHHLQLYLQDSLTKDRPEMTINVGPGGSISGKQVFVKDSRTLNLDATANKLYNQK